MLWSLLKSGRRMQALIFAIICFVTVFSVFALSCWRLARHRGSLRGKGYLVPTALILALNAVAVAYSLLNPADPWSWHH